MILMETVNATDVRREFSRFVDTVVHNKPAFFKRNRDYVLALSLEQVSVLLDEFVFHVTFQHEFDGSITAALEEIDIAANAADKQSVLDTLAEDLLEYSREYMDNFQLYVHSPNRKAHFPYILKVLSCPNLPGVVNLLNA